MSEKITKDMKNNMEKGQLQNLTRQQLKELEEKKKTGWQKALDWLIMILPFACGLAAMLEYWMIPNGSPNDAPYTYVWFLVVLMGAYLVYFVYSAAKKAGGDKTVLDMLRYRAPLLSALFLLLWRFCLEI